MKKIAGIIGLILGLVFLGGVGVQGAQAQTMSADQVAVVENKILQQTLTSLNVVLARMNQRMQETNGGRNLSMEERMQMSATLAMIKTSLSGIDGQLRSRNIAQVATPSLPVATTPAAPKQVAEAPKAAPVVTPAPKANVTAQVAPADEDGEEIIADEDNTSKETALASSQAGAMGNWRRTLGVVILVIAAVIGFFSLRKGKPTTQVATSAKPSPMPVQPAQNNVTSVSTGAHNPMNQPKKA